MIDTAIHGDALEILRTLPNNSVDSIVTDPPAGIAFMGKDWDNFTGKEKTYDSAGARAAANADKEKLKRIGQGTTPFGFSSSSGQPTRKERDAFITFLTEVMQEALRVLKPGGHALVWALPRTSHWTALALEDAGFEVREKLYHIFGSGFPKSHNISVAIDKHLKAEREIIGVKPAKHSMGRMQESAKEQGARQYKKGLSEQLNVEKYGGIPETAPATPEAQKWQGWGSATKPAVEEWILCRKPLAESSIAANVLKYGTGGINVDACRVNANGEYLGRPVGQPLNAYEWSNHPNPLKGQITSEPQGRFPSHLLLSHSLFCTPQHEDESCPIRALDEQSGVRKSGDLKPGHKQGHGNAVKMGNGGIIERAYGGDQGGASRYFTNFPPDDFTPFLYTSKASRRERNLGLPEKIDGALIPECEDGFAEVAAGGYEGRHDGGLGKVTMSLNTHPTVKPLQLMRWLIRLITPPGGVVLDCFAGSGSTLVAAIHEGVHFIGIEQSEEYCTIARSRIAYALQGIHGGLNAHYQEIVMARIEMAEVS